MMPQVYVDLDGVMADFDGHYEACFGVRPDKQKDNVDWSLVASVPTFYRDLPLMPDARELWDFVSKLGRPPMILTGCPKSIPTAKDQKRAMVRERIDRFVHVIACRSIDKSVFANPGDILIDDWEKYRALWENAGGRWITHTSAASSIEQLRRIL